MHIMVAFIYEFIHYVWMYFNLKNESLTDVPLCSFPFFSPPFLLLAVDSPFISKFLTRGIAGSVGMHIFRSLIHTHKLPRDVFNLIFCF